MNVKELINYCERKSSSDKNSTFKKSAWDGGYTEYTIQSFPPEDKEIEKWVLERIKKFIKLRYLFEIYTGTEESIFEQKLKYLRKAERLTNFRLVVNGAPGASSYIQYNGLYISLEDFDNYKEVVNDRLRILKNSVEEKIDEAMQSLGELSQKYEDLVSKIKELNLEEDND